MAYCHDTDANARALAALLPRMPALTARAGLHCECQAVNNPTNPLNIRYTGGPGQVGKNAVGFAVYSSVRAGLAGAAGLILHLKYYAGVRAVLPTGDALA